MKKKYIIILLLYVLPFLSVAQRGGTISFEKTLHEFGVIKEENGLAEAVFIFVNKGKKALKLTGVKPSCGCTTPEWTKGAIMPNKSGFVKAVYNPSHRPGKFNKSITVQTDGTPEVIFLQISGRVIPRPKGVKDWYPIQSGNLRFKSTYISFGKILHDSTDTASIVVYNTADKPIEIDWSASSIAPYIQTDLSSITLAPKRETRILLTYDADLKNDWGYLSDYIKIETSDSIEPEKGIHINANIIEHFKHTDSNQLPKISFDKQTHHFGEIGQNQRVSTAFIITNEGKKNLILRKVKASCGCTATRPDKTLLAPGKSTQIQVTFSSGTKKGKKKKSVTVISNDPTQNDVKLWIEANIKVPEDRK